MSILLKLIHELNQPLTVIKAYVGGCILRLKRNELSHEQMLSILEKVNEQAELFENKVYSMQQVILQEEDSDIHSIIRETTSLFTYDMRHHGIKLILDFHQAATDFRIDKALLKQIVFRLLNQCIAAVKDQTIQNAEITIQTELDKENVLNSTIRCNAPIKETMELDNELTYCRSLLPKDSGVLFVDLLPNSVCFKFKIFIQED